MSQQAAEPAAKAGRKVIITCAVTGSVHTVGGAMRVLGIDPLE